MAKAKIFTRSLILMASLSLIQLIPTALATDFLSADKKGSKSADNLFGRKKPLKGDIKEGLSGKASLGYSAAAGNTDNQNINASVKAQYIIRPWRHNVVASVYFAEKNGEDTAERYALSHKVNYSMGDDGYVFNFLSYDTDKFASIDSRIADVLGYGRNIFNTDRHNLDGEIGLGYRQTEYTTDGREDVSETIGHVGLNYTGKVTDSTTLNQNLLVQGGSDNIFSESETALTVKMSDKLSLSVNYTIRNNTEVPAGVEKTDTATSVNLVADF